MKKLIILTAILLSIATPALADRDDHREHRDAPRFERHEERREQHEEHGWRWGIFFIPTLGAPLNCETFYSRYQTETRCVYWDGSVRTFIQNN